MQGVDVSDMTIGPMSSVTLSSGRELTASDANSAVVVVNSSYATQNSIKVGSTETLGGTKFTVVGIVTTSSSEDYFMPLAEAQKISSDTGKVTTVYVKAASSTQISTVASEISKTASGSTVSTSADLASSVSGSLSSTASLANNLGKWLSIGVLLAAFLVAALFTMAAVGRRTREFGTLKAIGWTSGRVVRQVLGESIVTGLIGGVIGIGIGYARCVRDRQVRADAHGLVRDQQRQQRRGRRSRWWRCHQRRARHHRSPDRSGGSEHPGSSRSASRFSAA